MLDLLKKNEKGVLFLRTTAMIKNGMDLFVRSFHTVAWASKRCVYEAVHVSYVESLRDGSGIPELRGRLTIKYMERIGHADG